MAADDAPLEARRQQLDIGKEKEYAELAQERELEIRRASQATEIAQEKALKHQEAEQATIEADKKIKQSKIAADQSIETDNIHKDQIIDILQPLYVATVTRRFGGESLAPQPIPIEHVLHQGTLP